MKCNVGGADRMIRIIAGVVIILLGFYFQSWWGAVGVIPILTGTFRWCPAYIPFGFSTCEADKK
ncbi:MAG: hypothetical protein A4E68_02411 [Syntrophaceae bacterium PtaB.Bin095]|jgi:type IV secretory pathway TrbD component|nr:MAG: hypothetical protein A4E68_02411 [Syntrophaceae bacterium PtaB.Bin095]